MTENLKLEIKTLQVFDTQYSADSIEWCPDPNYRSYFACGTYELLVQQEKDEANTAGSSNVATGNANKTPTTSTGRIGRIYLFKYNKETKVAEEIQRIDTCGIFDMKWIPDNNCKMMLATANTMGRIDLFNFEDGELKKRTSFSLSCKSANAKFMALSLDWDKLNTDSFMSRISVSNSKGGIHLLEYSGLGHLKEMKTWTAHKYEAWTSVFDKWDYNLVYTGGDDAFLNGYDVRTAEMVINNKSHIAGVTCLYSHPKREYVLFSGSYDERLRIFDTRKMNSPREELNVHGGIWRIKLDPLDRDLLLIACMYKNFSIVKLDLKEQDPKLSIVGTYEEHESICYGADWCLDALPTDKQLVMATCSFYDHKLCVSNVTEAL